MGGLVDLRRDIAAVLEVVLPGRVFPAPPDTLVAPAIWVRRPAIVADQKGIRWYRVDLEVVIVVDTTTHAVWDELDDMVETCWSLLAKNGHMPVRSSEQVIDTGTTQSLYAEVISLNTHTACT